MAESTIELIPLRAGEMAQLIRATSEHGEPLNCAFGSGGAALIVDTSKPLSKAAELLGRMRGVLNQGTDGEGI